MLKGTGIVLIALLSVIADSSYVFAATPTEDSYFSIGFVFIITIAIAIVFGLILYYTGAKRVEYKSKFSVTTQTRVSKHIDQSLASVISDQIYNLSGSEEQKKQAAGTILNIFNERVGETTGLVKKKLRQRYGKIIEQKGIQLDTLSGQYNQTLTEKKQTESVLRSVAEGLVVVNENGEVILMNPAAEKLLGVQKEDKIGKPLLEDIKNEQLISLVKKTSSGEKEIVLTSQNLDTKKILRSSSAVIENGDGKTVGMVSVLSDITKQRALDQLKSDFISKVSHELRTPIGIIRQSISVFLDKAAGPVTADQEKLLMGAKRNLDRLSHLINDLLDLSRLEEKKMELKLEPCSLEKIIDDACESLDALAKAKIIDVKKFVPENLPQIQVDSFRITQVMMNLIGNALKFTLDNGLVIIEAKLRAEKKEIEVSVADTGIGIEKKDIPKVFDKFQQVGEIRFTDMSGTGLGLAIAKEIVELHKGRIWAESQKGKGSKFTFALPIE